MPAGAALSLGAITFGIGPDTTRLRSSISDITAFGNAVEAAAASTAAGAAQATAALLRQENAAISALQKVQKFQDQLSKSTVAAPVAQGLNNLSTTALQRMTTEMTSGRMSTLEYNRAMTQFGQTMSNAQRILTQYNAAQKQVAEGQMVQMLQKLNSAAVLVAGPLSGIATRISVITGLTEHFNLSTAALVAGVAAGAYAFAKLSTAVISVEKDLQKIMQTLVAVEGSTTIAGTTLNYLSGFADKSGISLSVLAKQYASLEAASKGTILEGERTRDIFEAVTMAGAKLGLSTDDVRGALLALQQMISKGSVQSEELRQQLGERIPGAMQIYASALGVTTQKLSQMLKQGEVGISTLTKFADALRKRYNIDNSTFIDTITAAEARLGNARMVALDQLDKIVGFSDAYKNVLNSLASALKMSDDQMRNMTSTIVGVGAALGAAFLAVRLVPAIIAITSAVGSLTAAIVSLNVASLAGGWTAIAKVVVAASAALVAYYGTQKLLQSQMDKAKQSYLSTLPAVEAYIDSQKKLASSIRQPTLEYIKQQEALLATMSSSSEAALLDYNRAAAQVDLQKKMGASAEAVDNLSKQLNLSDKADRYVKTSQALERVKANLKALNQILDEQTKKENANRTDPAKELTNRQTLALKNASDTVKELQRQYDALYLSPAAKQYADTQNDIAKQVENFRDQLTRTQLPASKVNEEVAKYAINLAKVKNAQAELKNTTSYFQALSDVFSRGLDTATQEWIDTILEGKDALTALKNVGKAVAADLLKTFMTLAAMNPLKNALFGTNYNTLGGSAGMGGLFGSFLNSVGLGGGSSVLAGSTPVYGAAGGYGVPTFGFANGGIMTSEGPLPLRKYAGGGIASGPQVALFGEGSHREAYVPLPDGRSIPVSLSGDGGSSGITINVYDQTGSKVDAKASRNASGQMQIDVWVRKQAVDAVAENILNGGDVATATENRYGLNRAKGLAQ